MLDENDPLVALQKTRQKLGFYIKNILRSMKGIKFFETLKVAFEKTTGDVAVSRAAYFHSKAQKIINYAKSQIQLLEGAQPGTVINDKAVIYSNTGSI